VQVTQLMSATHLPKDSDKEDALANLRNQGKKPYFIPSGASTHELGGLGYARCAFEIAMQEKELEGGKFDVVIVPTMSGSTLGGLVAGFKALELEEQCSESTQKKPRKRRLIGVLAGPKDKAEFSSLIASIAKTAAKYIGVNPESISDADFEIDDRWSAGQYGRLDDRTRNSVKLLASLEGIITDPVYSGKALTGLLERTKNGEIEEGQRVLFLHTGGTMSISAYHDFR